MSQASSASIEAEPTFTPTTKMAWIWIIFGFIGFIAAMALVIEKIHVLEQPAATLSCDFNVFVSCKSVMASWQSHLFGFPNPLIGVAGFSIPIAIGFATLAGAKLHRWFYQAMTVGFFMAFFFVLWLSTQSIYVINVLCPYCMLAWFGTIPLFWHTLIWAMSEDIIEMPISMTTIVDAAAKRPWLFSLVTELILVLLIVIQFWAWWPSTIKQVFA